MWGYMYLATRLFGSDGWRKDNPNPNPIINSLLKESGNDSLRSYTTVSLLRNTVVVVVVGTALSFLSPEGRCKSNGGQTFFQLAVQSNRNPITSANGYYPINQMLDHGLWCRNPVSIQFLPNQRSNRHLGGDSVWLTRSDSIYFGPDPNH